ncbi:hypothetical protein DPEC_G00209080 [Dallia pectoralis]|uniref:Uncharacterized protein n=1 Tax=Dallia pectoralis TaxID=75939 RepID=A0ACC2G5D8_DALPE|nr:hypothetical protein DPEC_G00209080 [Dallia pectoralis]
MLLKRSIHLSSASSDQLFVHNQGRLLQNIYTKSPFHLGVGGSGIHCYSPLPPVNLLVVTLGAHSAMFLCGTAFGVTAVATGRGLEPTTLPPVFQRVVWLMNLDKPNRMPVETVEMWVISNHHSMEKEGQVVQPGASPSTSLA